MLRTQFTLHFPHRVVLYARMSSEGQNPRSPDQQIATIRELIRRMNLRWQIVATYRDDAISGRYKRRRPQYQKMLQDLKSGSVIANLVLVDTFERLSRAEDNAETRAKLAKAGVLVLTADSQFHDPTTVSGRALAMVESIRATEDGRIKAHNVVRGKKDAVRLGRWPGGPVPFGFRLKTIMRTTKGVEEPDYRVVEPIPDQMWIVKLIFDLAAEQACGSERISRFVNQHPNLPEGIRFKSTTINYMLRNRIYIGEMIWGANCTGIIDDVRVLQRLPEDEWEINSNFCPPIVERAVFDVAAAHRAARKRSEHVKSEVGTPMAGLLARGIALTYPLSGLVVCGSCGRAMIASSSSPYITVSGEQRKYVSYCCRDSRPRGDCDNSFHVPEAWLRDTVMALVRQRLFLEMPVADDNCAASSMSSSGEENMTLRDRILNSTDFAEFMTQVRQKLEQMRPEPALHEATLEKERAGLNAACRGWRLSLGDPDLNLEVRRLLEEDLADARQRINKINHVVDEIRSASTRSETAVDREAVADRLARLSDVLSQGCASATNLQLAQHIDSIRCLPDGHVIVRTCHLGALANPLDFCNSIGNPLADSQKSDSDKSAVGRRRTRRRINSEIEQDEDGEVANDFAVNPARFAGLGPEWFTEDIYSTPQRTCWAEGHAVEVARYRIETQATMRATATRFGKTIPTIRQALKCARDVHGIDAFGKTISAPKRAFWPRDNAEAVADFFFLRPGATMKQAQTHFGKSQPWISKARRIAREQTLCQSSSDTTSGETNSVPAQSIKVDPQDNPEQRNCE